MAFFHRQPSSRRYGSEPHRGGQRGDQGRSREVTRHSSPSEYGTSRGWDEGAQASRHPQERDDSGRGTQSDAPKYEEQERWGRDTGYEGIDQDARYCERGWSPYEGERHAPERRLRSESGTSEPRSFEDDERERRRIRDRREREFAPKVFYQSSGRHGRRY